MTTTPSIPSIRPAATEHGSFPERAARLAAAQRPLVGRLQHATTADVARLDVVAGRFVLTGDLSYHGPQQSRLDRLAEWVATGAEWYLDCRSEWEADGEREFLAEHAPHIRYIHAPTDDDGRTRPAAWFDRVLDGLGTALLDDSVGIVTCHMGIRRAPSALFRILLAQGWHELDALAEIAGARSIAEVFYAADAFEHFGLGQLWGHVPSDPRR